MEPWPAVSPDMNPIEHLWDYMKRKMREQPPTQNSYELFELLTQIWDNISEEHVISLTSSMRRRVTSLLTAAGGHTRY